MDLRAADAGCLDTDDVPNFLAADLSFRDDDSAGHPGGPLAAMAGGAALAIPAVLHHEYWALPVNLLVAAIAGRFGGLRSGGCLVVFADDRSEYLSLGDAEPAAAASGPADSAAAAGGGMQFGTSMLAVLSAALF
jgi:hypothetical protein